MTQFQQVLMELAMIQLPACANYVPPNDKPEIGLSSAEMKFKIAQLNLMFVTFS